MVTATLLGIVPGGGSPARAVGGTLIDGFNDAQTVTVTSGGANPKSASGVATGSMLGGERDIVATRTNGAGTVVEDVDSSLPSNASYASASATRGRAVLTYDGTDGNAASLNATGLGGVDLTADNADRFHVRVTFADQATNLIVTAYTNATSCSRMTVAIPTTNISASTLVFPYSSFTTFCANPANFANIGALTLEKDATAVLATSADVSIDVFETAGLDYGDLPAIYNNTTLGDGGASHVTTQGLYLGADVDAEFDGAESAAANGDDVAGIDDEDGVVQTPGFGWSIANGGSVDVTASTDAYVSGWIDWNNDGDFADAGENVFDNYVVTAGSQTIPFGIPVGTTVSGSFFGRFRIFPYEDTPPARSVTGFGGPGEVEDHRFTLQPDLSITKTNNVTSLTPGDTPVYELTITNNGTQTATGVVVTDNVPANTSFVSASNSGSHAAGVVTWNIASLTPGQSVTRTMTVSVNNPLAAGVGTINNNASVTDDGTNGVDPTPGNNSASDTDPVVAQPDYSISKTDNVVDVTPGQSLTYILTICNNGNQGGTGVLVSDTLPTGTTYQSSTNSGSHAAGVVTWPTFTLAGGGACTTRNVTVLVNNPQPAGNVSTVNNATVTDNGANGTDPTPANNSATDTDTVDAAPDLTISKSDGVTATTPGSTLTYTLSIANVGNQDATGVVVTDTIPANTTFVSASNGGTFAAGVVTFPAFNLAGDGAPVTRTVTVQVAATVAAGVNTIVNTASVDDGAANGPDPTPGNNTATDTDTLNAAPDLTSSKSDGVNNTTPGSTLTYTLTVCNNGNQGATGIQLTDNIPLNTSFVSANLGGTEAAGIVSWPAFSLAAGACSNSRTVTVLVDNPVPAGATQITNTVYVFDDGDNGADPTPANNTGVDTDNLVAAPDLTIDTDDGIASTTPGTTQTYTLTITNVGNQGAEGVLVSSPLPANTTFVSASGGGVLSAGVVTWPTFSLGGGGDSTVRTVTVIVNGTVPAGVNTIVQNATVTDDGSNGADPTPANNADSDTDTLVAAPDLTITNTDGLTATAPGTTQTYTLTITNVGNQGATGVLVSDTIPANTTFVSASGGGTFAAGVVTWPTFGLAAGASTTRTVTVQVNATVPSGVTTIVNPATVSDDGANGADPTPANNSASDIDTLSAQPDIAVTKTDGVTSVSAGGSTTYTINACNIGNQDSSGVVITDNLPAGTTYVSSSNSGSHAAGVVTWPSVGIAAGGCVSRTVTVSVNAGTANLDNSIATGNQFTCTLQADSSVMCMGDNGSGQHGDGTTARHTSPIVVPGLTGVTALTAGRDHMCALISGGTVKCWGGNNHGQIGDGTTTRRLVPTTVPGLTGVTAISAGGRHTCALITGGTVKCWGDNTSNQIGDGTTTRRTSPTTVPGLTNVTGISAGSLHQCATISGGTVKCWGDNQYGQLGDGTTVRKSSPTLVSGLTNATQVEAGDSHTCAVTTGGGVLCWGRNNDGQLGDGTTANKLVPTAVSGLASGVNRVVTGGLHTCARLSAGAALKCWGNNADGRLGDDSTTRRLTPVSVFGPLGGVVAFDLGTNHTCVLTSGGYSCFGNNTQGQFGNATKANNDRPTPMINQVPPSSAPPSITNTATGTDNGANGADPNTANNTGTDTNTVV